jgi:hypothetical protein
VGPIANSGKKTSACAHNEFRVDWWSGAEVATPEETTKEAETMTKVKVSLVYDNKPDRELIVELKGAPKGLRLMNAIESAVEKAAKDDKEWTRWNLIDVLSSQSK